MPADPQQIVAQVYAILGRPDIFTLPPEDVKAARRRASTEVIRAIAGNLEHPNWSDLAELVDVDNDSFLPEHVGEVGIPKIIPFSSGVARDGLPADSDEIDAYIADATTTFPIYSGAIDGVAIPHNTADVNGRRSPLSCRYSIVNGYFKFTGYSAQIPLIVLTTDLLDNHVPLDLAPTVIKLMIPMLVKPTDNLFPLAPMYGAMGQQDLIEIAGGAKHVAPAPTPDITQAQKQI